MSERTNHESVNVALLGYGYAGKTFHAPLIESVPGLKLAAVVSSSAAKVAQDRPDTVVYSDAELAFNDSNIDLIVIATPNDTHCDLAQRALAAGKHVVVDKPLATSSQEALALAEAGEKSNRMLSVFQNRRWDADFLTVKQILSEKRLGDIVHFESHFDRYRPEVRQRWRELPGPGGGIWFDLGPHLLDQALQLFGKPQAIFADLEVARDGASAVDYFHAILQYGKCKVILHASALVAAETPRFIIHGSKGSFVKFGLDVQEDALKRGEKPATQAEWGVDHHAAIVTTWNGEQQNNEKLALLPGNYSSYYAAVRDSIVAQTPNPVPVSQIIEVMNLLELGVESSRTRKEIAL